MRERVGSVVRRKGRGKGAKPTWWARVTYTDPVTGKRHDRQRRAENKVDAGDKVHELLAEVDATGGQSLAREHMTFLDRAFSPETKSFACSPPVRIGIRNIFDRS